MKILPKYVSTLFTIALMLTLYMPGMAQQDVPGSEDAPGNYPISGFIYQMVSGGELHAL